MEESTKFGNRFLKNQDEAFTHNAWDQVEMDLEMHQDALNLIQLQLQSPASPEKVARLDENPASFWDKFYSNNANKFFKDRNWLTREFPELLDSRNKRICEVGCGAGNTVFPYLKENESPEAFAYCFDYSATAVEVVKSNPLYDSQRYITSPTLPPEIEPGSLDLCLCIFVISAIHPRDWEQASKNIYSLLKPGGVLLFRDYGRHDLAQLRFKSDRLLEENFYCRGDNTRVYFFTNEELESIFSKFNVLSNVQDRRLLINRSLKLKMYRCWLQAKFQKPFE